MNISKEAGRVLLDSGNLERGSSVDTVGHDTRRERSLLTSNTAPHISLADRVRERDSRRPGRAPGRLVDVRRRQRRRRVVAAEPVDGNVPANGVCRAVEPDVVGARGARQTARGCRAIDHLVGGREDVVGRGEGEGRGRCWRACGGVAASARGILDALPAPGGDGRGASGGWVGYGVPSAWSWGLEEEGLMGVDSGSSYLLGVHTESQWEQRRRETRWREEW